MKAAGVLGAALGLLLAAIPAGAVSNGEGDLVTNFEGELRPASLPRTAPAPVAIHVAGGLKSASGNSRTLPQLQQLTIAINRQGSLFSAGLPTCSAEEIQPATEAGARATCGKAIIGSGYVTVQVRIPDQIPFSVRARLLLFNAPGRNGERLILAQAYNNRPPSAFVINFHVRKGRGVFGTVLTATLSKGLRQWAYLTHFDITLHRTYSHGGRRRSYVSAACAAPAGFDSAIFPFARATYGLAGGQRLSMTVTDSCRVAG